MPTFSFLYSIPYIILFLLLYVNVIPICKTNATSSFNNNYYIWLQQIFIAVLLIIFLGFRGFVYTDWVSYYRLYNSSPTIFDDEKSISIFFERGIENGFLFYMIVCKTISSNYFFFQCVSFVIDYFILLYFFKRIIPKHIVFGFLFFFLFAGIGMSFSLIRNSKAIMLFLISLKYLEKRNFAKYVILNFIGTLFHISSLLYIPLYFFIHKNIHRIVLLFIFLIGNVLFLFQIEWVKLFLTFISTIISGRLGHLLNMYLLSDFYSSAYGITIGYIERFFSFMLIYYFSKKLCKINKANLIYINVFYLYSFIFLYFSEMMIILERVAILYIFPYWILYPQIYSLINKKNKQLFLLLLLFYGVLKMGVGNRNVFSLYDNILLPHRTYQERKLIIDQHEKYIFNQ